MVEEPKRPTIRKQRKPRERHPSTTKWGYWLPVIIALVGVPPAYIALYGRSNPLKPMEAAASEGPPETPINAATTDLGSLYVGGKELHLNQTKEKALALLGPPDSKIGKDQDILCWEIERGIEIQAKFGRYGASSLVATCDPTVTPKTRIYSKMVSDSTDDRQVEPLIVVLGKTPFADVAKNVPGMKPNTTSMAGFHGEAFIFEYADESLFYQVAGVDLANGSDKPGDVERSKVNIIELNDEWDDIKWKIRGETRLGLSTNPPRQAVRD